MNIIKKPWQSRYGWIWYNAKEIFEYTQKDMDDYVKQYADQGINILIGFSCTHFRFTFYNYWKEINACIEKIVKACHKYDILYVEHHSCHLTFNPKLKEDFEYINNMFTKRYSKLSNFAKIILDTEKDFQIDGQNVSSFHQISGKTGTYGTTMYHGYAMCFNNPDYKRIYLDYLKSLYEIGIDGIMTDDVQYFGNDGMGWSEFNACTCIHCRKLFKQKYGYEIPLPSDWKSFYWNFENKVFVAWKRFKDESTLNFVYEVEEHYKNLGYNQFRPNYISSILPTNKTAYPFEKCSEVWDCVFQENCNSNIIKESYLCHGLEAIHRYHLARLNKVPSMSMYYPSTQDNLYFSWALTKSWGQLYTACIYETKEGKMSEKHLRDFERRHIASYTNPKKITDLAFLLSSDTRDYSNGCETHQVNFLRWLEASYLSGISTDMIFEDAKMNEFKKHKVIVCAHTVMLSDSVLNKLRKYIKEGGHLITIGEFAKYKPDGTIRKRITMGRKNEALGDGNITVLSDNLCHNKYHWTLSVPRFIPDFDKIQKPVEEYAIDQLRETGGKAILSAIGNETIVNATSNQDIFTSLFKIRNGYALHIVNVQDTISKEGTATHVQPIESFIENASRINHEINIRINLDIPVKKVTLYSPERKRALDIPYMKIKRISDDMNTSDTGLLSFTIPKKTFSGYALLEIK